VSDDALYVHPEQTWLGSAPLLWRHVMSLDGTLGIRVNGEHRRVPSGISIAEMVNGLGLDPLRVAVELNLAIVPRSTLGEVRVEDGDDFEIVHFVGGG
jgi:thiamine biosynthesis protein ThiS